MHCHMILHPPIATQPLQQDTQTEKTYQQDSCGGIFVAMASCNVRNWFNSYPMHIFLCSSRWQTFDRMSRDIAKHVKLIVQKYIMHSRGDYKLCQPKVDTIIKWSSNLLNRRTLFSKKYANLEAIYIENHLRKVFFLLSSHILLPYVNMVHPLFKKCWYDVIYMKVPTYHIVACVLIHYTLSNSKLQ